MDFTAIIVGAVGAITGILALCISIRGDRRTSALLENGAIGQPRWVNDDLFQIEIGGVRAIILEELIAVPLDRQNLLHPKHDLPQTLAPNDTFEFLAEEGMSLHRPDAIVKWRWEGSNKVLTTRRMVAVSR